jgi:hypothetical protein
MEADQFLLCEICLGMSEESMIDLQPQSQDSIDGVRRVYYHQPNLLALERSAINGCLVCKWVFEGFSKSDEVSHADLRLDMALTAGVDCSLNYDDASETSNCSNSVELELSVSKSKSTEYSKEQLSSCMPMNIKLTGSLEDRTVRLVWEHYFPPPGSALGQIFVSKGPNGVFHELDFVVSGRLFDGVLQAPVMASIEVFTSQGEDFAPTPKRIYPLLILSR